MSDGLNYELEAVQIAVARSVMDSLWQMGGGDGPSPDEPTPGAMQIAWQVLQNASLNNMRRALHLLACVAVANEPGNSTIDILTRASLTAPEIAWVVSDSRPPIV